MFQQAVITILQAICIILMAVSFFILDDFLVFSTLVIVSFTFFLSGMQKEIVVFREEKIKNIKKSALDRIGNLNASLCSIILSVIYLNNFIIFKAQNFEETTIPPIFIILFFISFFISITCFVIDEWFDLSNKHIG